MVYPCRLLENGKMDIRPKVSIYFKIFTTIMRLKSLRQTWQYNFLTSTSWVTVSTVYVETRL